MTTLPALMAGLLSLWLAWRAACAPARLSMLWAAVGVLDGGIAGLDGLDHVRSSENRAAGADPRGRTVTRHRASSSAPAAKLGR